MLESTSATFPGFRLISYWKRLRLDFEAKLKHTVDMDNDYSIWRLPKSSGGLL